MHVAINDGRLRVWSMVEPSIRATEQILGGGSCFRKWIRFGFVVFLETIDRVGGALSVLASFLLFPAFTLLAKSGTDVRTLEQTVSDRMANLLRDPVPVFLGVILLLTLACVLWLVAIWIRSRATFMFVHLLAVPDATFGEAWRRNKAGARSLVTFFIGYYTVVPVVLFGCITTASFLMGRIAGAESNAPLSSYIWTALPFVLAILVTVVVGNVLMLFLRSFVVPIMYRFDISCWQAWWRLWDISRDNLLPLCGFVLVEIVYGLVLYAASSLLGMLTCYVAYIPPLMALALAPLYLAERVYTLRVLESAEPRCNLLAGALPLAAPQQEAWSPPPPPLDWH